MNFVDWCKARGCTAYPTQPRLLAEFVSENANLGIDWAMRAIEETVTFNLELGLANPAATPAVIAALDKVELIERPRSWPKEQWPHFRLLPHATKKYVVARELDRDREIRRMQNSNAALKKELEKTVGKANAE